MPPPAERASWRSRYTKSDLALAVLGVALALFCALFPWYIFYNRDQFGIRPLEFEGSTEEAAGAGLDPRSRLSPAPMTVPELAPTSANAGFDPTPTGTTGALPLDGAPKTPPGLDEQPFPARPGDFRLVYVANGRAMIEDDRGLWMVEPGSRLPDDSRVASIEQRAGRWVLVTDEDRVVAMGE